MPCCSGMKAVSRRKAPWLQSTRVEGMPGVRSNKFNQQRRAQTEGERGPGVGLGARFKRPK